MLYGKIKNQAAVSVVWQNQKSSSCECCIVKSKIKQLWMLYGKIKNQAAVSIVW